MADFNQVLTPGKTDDGLANTVVEIPQGSRLKVEWHRETATFMLDRVEPGIFAKPCNYGFIPQTLDEDGDELDTLIICPEPLATGVWLEARIVGVLKFEDDGEVDDKVVVVPADNRDDDRIARRGHPGRGVERWQRAAFARTAADHSIDCHIRTLRPAYRAGTMLPAGTACPAEAPLAPMTTRDSPENRR